MPFPYFFLGQNMSKFNVCAQIHMILGSLPCLCLDLHAYEFFALFMLRSTSLCLDLCVYVLHAMLVCLDLCWLLCHVLLQPFRPLIFLFLEFLPLSVGCRSRSCGLGLHPHTQAYIKGFGSFPLCISMFACLLQCFMSMFGSLDLGFAMLCALCGLVLVDPQRPLACVVAFVPPRACLDVTTYEIDLCDVGVLDTHLSLLHAMLICLPSCIVPPIQLSLLLLHFCTLAYLFMHESVCRLYYNPMKLWTLDPNLHFSSQDTLHLFDNMVVCPLLYAQHALFSPVWLSLLVCSWYTLSFSLVSSFTCLLACSLCLCMYTYGAWILGARVRAPRHKQKGQGCKQEDTSPLKGSVQQIKGSSPSRVVFSFSLFKPLLQSIYQDSSSPCTLLLFLLLTWATFPGYGNVCFTFPVPCWAIPLEHWQCLFTFLLCVIALYMMYVYIYICLRMCG